MEVKARFECIEANAELIHKNDRIEKHGEESVLACDLSFVWETDNGCLAMFHPSLKSALYGKGDNPQLEIEPDPAHMTALRFPQLQPLKWGGGDLVGGELTFHYGTGGKSNVELDIVKLGKFRLECKEGGTVAVHFQVAVRPTEAQAGKLSRFLNDGMCMISVEPPAVDAVSHGDD